MGRSLDGAQVTHSRSDKIIVETDEGEMYKIYPLGDTEPAAFSGTPPPEGATITSIGSDSLTYKTLSGETDSAIAAGGEENAYIEIEQLE
jgi:hypothetical protein